MICAFFFCKRKTAYEMRISDGSSDVCASDLRRFARAIVMPNLSPPVTTVAEGLAYRDRIAAAVPPELEFTPLIVAYLTDRTDPEELARGHAEGVFTAAKLYPAHATTGSAHGVTDIAAIRAEEHTSELQSLMRTSYAVV